MKHQRPHIRTSKRGRKFRAGKGVAKARKRSAMERAKIGTLLIRAGELSNLNKEHRIKSLNVSPMLLEMGAIPNTPEWARNKLSFIYESMSEDEIKEEKLIPEWTDKLLNIERDMTDGLLFIPSDFKRKKNETSKTSY